MTYEYKTIKVEIDEDGVAVVTLNLPEKLNPMSDALTDDIADAFHRLRADPICKAVVLTGAGRAFCAGGDMEGLEAGLAAWPSMRMRPTDPLGAITGCEKPVICAMNGLAVGGGAGLVLSCDVIFVADTARFSMIFARIGFVPDTGTLYNLPRAVGPWMAKYLCYDAGFIDAQEMCRLGIAQKVFPADQLMAETTKFAKKLAEGPGLSYKLTKSIIDRAWGMSLEQYYDLEAFAIEIANHSEDFREGVQAFVEKRKPIFQGK